MKIKINPVYGKEIKLRVRSIKFALTIFFFNLILVIIALTGFEVMFNARWNPYVDYSGAAKVYFILISLEILMVMFLIPSFTAGSVAGEREKQTLDILLTTVLKPRHIVMGKLMSSISMVLLLVFSSLPIISIVFTIGGVGMMDLIQFMVVIVVISLFVGSMGMLASTMIKKTVQATVFSFAEVVIVCVGTILVIAIAYLTSNIYYYNVMNGVGNMPDVSFVSWILLINPAFTVFEMVLQQYGSYSAITAITTWLNGSLPSIVIEHWFMFSLISQLVATYVLIRVSAKFLNPLRRRFKRSR